MKTTSPLEISAARRFPRCVHCGSHIGTGARVCGACRSPRPLNLAELTRLGKLARKHWFGGTVRDLVQHQTYRPTLYVTPPRSLDLEVDAETCKAVRKEYQERAELANLYDRTQAQQGTKRRAVRI